MSQHSVQYDGNGLKIINASLFRMGTKSMAMAYQILGFKTHHGLLESVMDSPWTQIEEAAEATWPGVPGGTPRPPYQRKDWDALWGDKYDAVTDLASPFALELIDAYPEAKVVVVQRDFDTWWPTFQSQIRDKVMLEPNSSFHAFITWWFLGIRPVHAMCKVILGFFGARTRLEVDADCARAAYDAYFREIRARVPLERRLEYKLGSGWEPLCAFLGVNVPNEEFPSANEKQENSKESRARENTFIVKSIKVSAPWLLAVGAAWAAWGYAK